MPCRIVDLQDCAYGFLEPEAAASVRDHAAACDRCRADLARLEGEKAMLSRAASELLPRERRTAAPLFPLAFAAGLLVGLLWLLIPREPAPSDVVAVPAGQEKGQDKGGSQE